MNWMVSDVGVRCAGAERSWDVVVAGGGHNGLVAAAYLGRAGLSVLLLEKLPRLGGATSSQEVFRGVSARLSRYSYLISLLPPKVVNDLGLHLDLRRRRIAACAPYDRDGKHRALLLSNDHPELGRESSGRAGWRVHRRARSSTSNTSRTSTRGSLIPR